MIDRGSELGVTDFVFGMPHRGRLNCLVNVLRKPMQLMLKEFQVGGWVGEGGSRQPYPNSMKLTCGRLGIYGRARTTRWRSTRRSAATTGPRAAT